MLILPRRVTTRIERESLTWWHKDLPTMLQLSKGFRDFGTKNLKNLLIKAYYGDVVHNSVLYYLPSSIYSFARFLVLLPRLLILKSP